MKNLRFLTILIMSAAAALTGACAGDSATVPAPGSATASGANTANSANSVMSGTANSAANGAPHDNSADAPPAAVKAVFTDAQSFTTQHKDVPDSAAAAIEKDTGGKIPDKDHHAYLAFGSVGGKRTQLGAATVVKAGGKDVIVVYENKNGMPTVKEVRADGVSGDFLKQFAGKNHDAPIKFGADIKALGGVSEEDAKTIAQAVRIDVLTMEALYGAAHTH